MVTKTILKILGIEQAPVSHFEKIVSAVGGFIAIAGIILVSRWALDPTGANIIVASMGASAVLLFVVPHGPLSQPWAVVGGHLISSCIGVTCAKFIPYDVLAASLAVGLSIGVMYYLRCAHPPGGASALTAVIGGDVTHALGYQFVLTPILINVFIILTIAIGFNYIFHWRRYPRYIHQKQSQAKEKLETESAEISHSDFQFAMRQIDSYIDISESDLRHIYELAKQARKQRMGVGQVILGAYYSNGEYGNRWSIRQVVDESQEKGSEKDMIIYKGVAGQGRRTSGYMKRADFMEWAKYQVRRDDENWKRVDHDEA